MPSEKLLRNLRVMRAVRNWELQEVAKRAGISSLTVSRIFNGDTENPGVETLAKIVEALGYTTGNFRGRSQSSRLFPSLIPCARIARTCHPD